VSKHNRINEDVVRDYLNALPGIELRETSSHFVVKDCSTLPEGLCQKPSGTDEASNQWKVNIANGRDPATSAGTYLCFRCQAKGSWYDLKKLGTSVGVEGSGGGGGGGGGGGRSGGSGEVTRGLEAAVKWDQVKNQNRGGGSGGGNGGHSRSKPMLR
jgi:hypothetical protein